MSAEKTEKMESVSCKVPEGVNVDPSVRPGSGSRYQLLLMSDAEGVYDMAIFDTEEEALQKLAELGKAFRDNFEYAEEKLNDWTYSYYDPKTEWKYFAQIIELPSAPAASAPEGEEDPAANAEGYSAGSWKGTPLGMFFLEEAPFRLREYFHYNEKDTERCAEDAAESLWDYQDEILDYDKIDEVIRECIAHDIIARLK